MRQLSGAGLRCVQSMSSSTRIRILVALLVACWWSQAPLARAQVLDQPDGLNIDCGSSFSYTDPVSGIQWVSDVPFIPTGESQTNLGTSNASNYGELKSLRSFPDPRFTKNCYTLPVIKNETYLLRASFAFENFDDSLKPPTFQLALEGTVVENITTTSTGLVYKELVYIAQGNTTFLCLVRDSSESTPFISAVSLKLVTNAYITPTTSLRKYVEERKFMTTRTRINFGGNVLIRSPSDAYDRYWHPEGSSSSYLRSTAKPVQSLSTATAIDGLQTSLEPPSAVLQTAVTTTGNLTSYVLAPGSETYNSTLLILHFAELDASSTMTTRQFYISVSRGLSPTLVNPFNATNPPKPFQVLGWSLSDQTIGPTTQVVLYPTAVSQKGPVLNALELYTVSNLRLERTIERDVLAIETIKAIMNLTEWTGDPCLPTPHPWVKCSQGNQELAAPEITEVNLTGCNLNGFISPSFADLLALTNLSLGHNALIGSLPDLSPLKNLKVLRLENNNLSGALPEWLTSFSQLVELSVQNNNFSGDIPPKLLSSNSLLFSFCPGNQFRNRGCDGMGVTSNFSKPAQSNLGAVIGASVGGVLVLVLIITGVCFGYRRYHREATQETIPFAIFGPRLSEKATDDGSVKPFTLAALTAATNNFKTELGKGGFGSVYYGTLPDGREVAVKVAAVSKCQGDKEFFNEVDLLSRVHHRNLVALIGYCHQKNKQILVYEYVQSGSLYDQLHGTPENIVYLDWRMRLKIALNTAEGLEYLHTTCNPSIIHRDVKSSNILLTGPDQPEVAMVADFGLSRRGPLQNATHVSTFVKGTAGYLDPQYYDTQKLTLKSDVFSFGVVLLELLTGRMPINSKLANRDEWNLCSWVRMTMETGNNLDKILDSAVRASNPNPDSLMRFVEIALRSVEPKSVHRPTMTEVVREIRTAIMLEGSQTEHSSRGRREFSHKQSLLSSSDHSSNAYSANGTVLSPR